MRHTRSRMLLGVLGALALTAWSSARLEGLAAARGEAHELLYLPNGDYLRVASLGQAPVLADAIYIWAIQFYADYEREDRFRYVEHVFGDVIAKLDPHYTDAYWMGAMILSIEAHDLDAALRLLDRGIANNPDDWLLPWVAAWECYHSGEIERSIPYFERAASIPGAPPSVQRTRAGVLGKAGDTARAIAEWLAIYEDPDSDERSRRSAERQLRRLKTRADIEAIAAAVERFRGRVGRFPESVLELVREGDLAERPVDLDGRPYEYDPATGTVLPPQGDLFRN